VVLNRVLLISELKNRDELGFREAGRLIANQRQATLELVAAITAKGVRLVILGSTNVARSNYYRGKETTTIPRIVA